MDRRALAIALVALLVLGLAAAYLYGPVRPPVTTGSDLDGVAVPDGFSIAVYAEDLGGPRLMETRNGALYVSVPSRGEVVALPDTDGDGTPEPVTAASGLDRPHGIAFHDGHLYVAETDAVVRFRMDGTTADASSREVLVDGIPTGGHWTRTILIRNGSLYIAAGSSCNVCEESSPWRAAVTRCTLDGENCSRYATGLRNTVGMVVHDGMLVGTDNGRDLLGNDVPPDEVNVIRQGNDYGWPYCYGDRVPDPAFGDAARCTGTTPPAVPLQAHSAPLGLGFAPASWPEPYANDLYVAYHGSWNRNPPTGYMVVRIPYHPGNRTFGAPHDFAAGWLKPDGTNTGRPVDVAFLDGDMYVTDDATGRIYRVSR